MTTRYTIEDVRRKADLINNRLPDFTVRANNPGDSKGTRYEFAGWVYLGAAEACRALDAMLYVLRELDLTAQERRYVARAIDVARSDGEAAAMLSPTERDDLLRKFGGRDQ